MRYTLLTVLSAGLLLPSSAAALFQQEGGQSQEDLAKVTQNPVGDLISLPFQNNTNFDVGPAGAAQNILNIQPVWPLAVGDKWNLITRTIVPVISQPALFEGADRTFGIGDITFTAFLSPKKPGKLIWGVGPVVLLPTSTNDALGAGEWGLGPSIVLLTMRGSWVLGSLFSNVWSLGASEGQGISLFTWQPFINYNMANGWYLTSAPILTANWKAESGDKWTVPLGAGAGKIFRIGAQPMNGQVALYRNVGRPEGGASWQLRVQLQLLFPK